MIIFFTRWAQLLKTSVRVFFCAEKRNKLLDTLRTRSDVYLEPFFNEIFLVLDTIFYRKSLELTKNYHQRLNYTQRVFIIKFYRNT